MSLFPCMHIHVSGRSCGLFSFAPGSFCSLHLKGRADGSTFCSDCDAMLEVFPFRNRRGMTGDTIRSTDT